MNNPLSELFSTNKDFYRYCADADTKIEDLFQEAITSKKTIVTVIGDAIYNKIVVSAEDAPEKNALRMAMVNLCMHKNFPISVIAKRKGKETDIYKHEQEKIMRLFNEHYANAMDTLLSIVESSEAYKNDFAMLPYSKLRELLPVKSAAEMNIYYPIDSSYLFFLQSVPVQLEVMDNVFGELFARINDRADLTGKLKRAFVKYTVAMCMKRLDMTSLPKTIRNLFDDSKAMRYATQETLRVDKIAAELIQDAVNTIDAINSVLNAEVNNAVDIVTATAENDEKNKFYVIA